MSKTIVSLYLLLVASKLAFSQSVPAGWKPIDDERRVCRVLVPPDWKPSSVAGVANPKVISEGSVTVVSDSFQLKPVPQELIKTMKIDTIFENTAKRVFYASALKDRISYTISVPSKNGSCTATVSSADNMKDLAKQIALSLGAAK